ncbi:MAG: hypothetical protein DWP98_10090 [Bacteroidetes bacterium]|nr:MAG: hypothetical protein DWP98_10090 [Bacteroidota bacterium]MBL1144101.1 hypothetical protein [Bacteroidota bacterium]NOG56896.1 tetratricopeptide repeat protein [Bacteroidota bacterium]
MHKARLSFLFLFISIFALGENRDSVRIERMVDLAFQLEDQFPDSAFILSRQVILASKKIDFKIGESYGFLRLGSIYYGRGTYDSALYYSKKAAQIRQEEKDIVGACGALITVSDVYQAQGKIDSAIYTMLNALQLSSKADNNALEIKVLLQLGNLYLKYKQENEALKYYSKAENKLTESSAEDLKYLVKSAFGEFFISNKKYDDALKKYIEALEYTNENLVYKSSIYNNMAVCFENLSKLKLAQEFYTKALEIHKQLNLGPDIALSYFNIGSVCINRALPDSAILFLNKSLGIAKMIGDINREAKVFEHLSDAFKLKKDYLTAYNMHVRYVQLADSLLNIEKIQSISEMQTKYETIQKEQQIKLLNEQNKTKTAQRNLIIASSTVLFLILILLSIYFIQRSRIAQKNQLIAQQQLENLLGTQEAKTYNAMLDGQAAERNRIANDLHDRLGSMLSTIKLLFGSLEEKIDAAQGENKNQISRANNLIDEACVEVRRISHNLGSGMVADYGLVHALDDLCMSINQTKKINCKLLTYNVEDALSLNIEVELYRIVQEVLNNALKHAEAKNITVQLNRLDEELSLTIEDDGKGFDVKSKMKSGGMGLANIEMRSKKINGTLHIDSALGKGTTTIIEVPLNNSHD